MLRHALLARASDITIAVVTVTACALGGSGPPSRKAEGYPPLETTPGSSWVSPVWAPGGGARGDLEYPLHWRGADGEWDPARSCGPVAFDACYYNLSSTVPWCCHVMDNPSAPVFDERVYSWELGAYWAVVAAISLAIDATVDAPPGTSCCAGFAVATALASLTMPIKVAVGRPRPSFYAQQYWALRSRSAAARDTLDDALKSFPSGHSTWSVCAGTYLSGIVRQYTPRTGRAAALVRISWEALPVSLGLWTAVTRLEDNRHHPADVVAGVLIGLVSGVVGLASRTRDVF